MNFSQDSDDEEHYEDLPAPDESEANDTTSSESSESEDEQKRAKSNKSSWVHKNLKNSGEWEYIYIYISNTCTIFPCYHSCVTIWMWKLFDLFLGFTKTPEYDPHHRNPLYCRADSECFWELQKLSQHFHPTVSLFASNLLKVIY